jgi:DNA-binding GntR family transcriptional regulator
MPTPNIKRVLSIPDGVPVLQLYRVMKHEDRVVAVIETHLPADQATLVFPRIPLHS